MEQTLNMEIHQHMMEKLAAAEENTNRHVLWGVDNLVQQMRTYYSGSTGRDTKMAKEFAITLKEARTHPMLMPWLRKRLEYPWAVVTTDNVDIDSVFLFSRERFGAPFLKRLLKRRGFTLMPDVPEPTSSSSSAPYTFSANVTVAAMDMIEELERLLLDHKDLHCFTAKIHFGLPYVLRASSAWARDQINTCLQATVKAPWQMTCEAHPTLADMLVGTVTLDPAIQAQLAGLLGAQQDTPA